MGNTFGRRKQEPAAHVVSHAHQPPKILKVILIADSGTGAKTCMLRRFVNGEFSCNQIITIGIDCKRRKASVPYRAGAPDSMFIAFLMSQKATCRKTTCRVPHLSEGILKHIHRYLYVDAIWNPTLEIWDTAGQERFQPIVRSYLGGTSQGGCALDAVVLGYDITDANSFQNILHWMTLVMQSSAHSRVPDTESRVPCSPKWTAYITALNTVFQSIQRLAADPTLNLEHPPDVLFPEVLQRAAYTKEMPLLTRQRKPAPNEGADGIRIKSEEEPQQRPVIFTLIGNKVDLEDQRMVPFVEGLLMSKVLSRIFGTEVAFYEISAKTGLNVTEAIMSIPRRAAVMWPEYQGLDRWDEPNEEHNTSFQ